MEKIVPYLIIGAVALVILIILIKNICIVQQSRAYVIERLGAFSQVWEVGIHFKLPFVERIARRVSLKEQVRRRAPLMRPTCSSPRSAAANCSLSARRRCANTAAASKRTPRWSGASARCRCASRRRRRRARSWPGCAPVWRRTTMSPSRRKPFPPP